MQFELEFYETETGEKPVEAFLLSLDIKMRAKMTRMMELLEEKGTELRRPYTAPLDDGIFELRCQQTGNITRALFFFYLQGKIIVTNGFTKKTPKTPPREISLAKKRRKDYIRQQGGKR